MLRAQHSPNGGREGRYKRGGDQPQRYNPTVGRLSEETPGEVGEGDTEIQEEGGKMLLFIFCQAAVFEGQLLNKSLTPSGLGL